MEFPGEEWAVYCDCSEDALVRCGTEAQAREARDAHRLAAQQVAS